MLLLPVGKITRARFISHVRRIEKENVVRLGDVSPDGRPNRSMDASTFKQKAMPAIPKADKKRTYSYVLTVGLPYRPDSLQYLHCHAP